MIQILIARIASALILASALTAAVPAAEPRVRPVGKTSSATADWVATDGRRVIFGAGETVRLGADATLTVDAPVSDAVLAGSLLYLACQDGTLRVLDVDAPLEPPRIVPLGVPLRSPARLALAGGALLVAESGRGMRIVPMEHAHHSAVRLNVAAATLVPVAPAIHGLAVSGRSVRVSVDGGLLELDLLDPLRGFVPRPLPGGVAPRALAANGTSLFLVGESGLQVCGPDSACTTAEIALRGSDIAIAGRSIWIAAGERGLLAARDATAGAVQHSVTVGNNFFSPQDLTLDTGDSVQWTNASGFHNVFSCIPEQLGCSGAQADDTFTSGQPADPIWVFSHTFDQPGSNPYICQSHAAFMAGEVTVEAPPALPPPVPDGTIGTPMTVGKLDAPGSTLQIDWDAATCPGAADFQIVYGARSQLPASPGGSYSLSGSQCAIGTDPPFVWNGVPDASADFLWWLITATNGSGREGSWGTDSAGDERDGPGSGGSSAECGNSAKILVNDCMP